MIGSTVWLFDANRREYRPGQRAPVFFAHFAEHTIVDETRTSWILDDRWLKIDKASKRLRAPHRGGYFGLSPVVYYSRQAVDDACYANDRRPEILNAIRACQDGGILRRVARLLGVPDTA